MVVVGEGEWPLWGGKGCNVTLLSEGIGNYPVMAIWWIDRTGPGIPRISKDGGFPRTF